MIKLGLPASGWNIPEGVLSRAHATLERFLELPTARRIQIGYKFMADEADALAQAMRAPLHEISRGKCAYCETPIAQAYEGEVGAFRPRYDATDLDGRGSAEHYLWLAVEPENLLLACHGCARAKRSLFPVMGKRAPFGTPLNDVDRVERRQLVNPYLDNPAEFLQFLESGQVSPRHAMGEVTIKVLNLNRSSLVNARRQAWSAITRRLTSRDSDAAEILRGHDETAAHSAVVRAAAEAFLAGPQRQSTARPVSSGAVSADEALGDAERYRLEGRPLCRVEVHNFRLLRDVVLQFPEPGKEAPCVAFLGENATGKSTLLLSIGLALAGADEAEALVNPRKLVTEGASDGHIKVYFWDVAEPVVLGFSRDSPFFTGTRGPSAFVLGYGPLRYAERRSRRRAAEDDARPIRIRPLVAPIARIRYPGRWLAELEGQRFEVAARALQSILPVDAGTFLTQQNGRVRYHLKQHTGSLAELSAGYQTVLGMAADVMRALFARWDTLASATAIVLIDEIDAHLHPRWRMRILGALREAFPSVQFIVTTHDPLILRGLHNGEVALLGRRGESVFVDQNLPQIEGMQVDELLTSRHFGLDSTMDPETEILLDEYYTLQSLPQTDERAARISELTDLIGDRESLGRNQREQMMLKVAGEYLRETEPGADDDLRLRAETLRRIREIVERGARRHAAAGGGSRPDAGI